MRNMQRSIPLYIVLSIITCGIFGIVWFVMLTDDLNELTGDPNAQSGIVTWLLSLVTCGIYGLYWAYKCGEKIDYIKQSRGIPASNSGVLYLIVYFFGGIITYALIQNEINNLTNNNNYNNFNNQYNNYNNYNNNYNNFNNNNQNF